MNRIAQRKFTFILHYSKRFVFFLKWLFNFGDDILISTLITTAESNLRTS